MDSKENLFPDIYRTYMPLIRMIAKDKNIPQDEIDDLVQDTFASYYTHYPLDWPKYKVKGALVRIIKNRCVDYYRKQGSHPVTYCDPAVIQETIQSIEDKVGRDSLSICLENQECEKIMSIVLKMKESWVSVFLLHEVEGRPIREVSEMLGISQAACRARLFRAKSMGYRI